MKGDKLMMLVGFFALLMSSCEIQEPKTIHIIRVEATLDTDVVDTLNYYAILNSEKSMEFYKDSTNCLVVNIYKDSTKAVSLNKRLACKIKEFNIFENRSHPANVTKIKTD